MNLMFDIIFCIVVAIFYTLLNLYCHKYDRRSLDDNTYAKLIVKYFYIYFLVMFFLLYAFKGLPAFLFKYPDNIVIPKYLISFFFFGLFVMMLDIIIFHNLSQP